MADEFVCKRCGKCCDSIGPTPPSDHGTPHHPDNELPGWFKQVVENLRRRNEENVGPCVFLNADRTCAIYHLCRPLTCRNWQCDRDK